VAARKIFLRFAQPSDAERLLKDGAVSGLVPGRDGWQGRFPNNAPGTASS
jgi:hypothetical protein